MLKLVDYENRFFDRNQLNNAMVRARRPPSSSKANPPPKQRPGDEKENKEGATEQQDAVKRSERMEHPGITDVAEMVPLRGDKRSSEIGKFLKKSSLNIR